MREVIESSCVHESPLQGFGFFGFGDLGRCPRLVWGTLLGLWRSEFFVARTVELNFGLAPVARNFSDGFRTLTLAARGRVTSCYV